MRTAARSAWAQISGQPTETWIIGALEGPVIASVNRLARDSIVWEWRSLRDNWDGCGVMVSVDADDVKREVEKLLVNAGMAKYRAS